MKLLYEDFTQSWFPACITTSALEHLALLQRHHSLHSLVPSFILSSNIFQVSIMSGVVLIPEDMMVSKPDVIPNCIEILMGYTRKEAGIYNKLKYVLQWEKSKDGGQKWFQTLHDFATLQTLYKCSSSLKSSPTLPTISFVFVFVCF